MWSKWPIPSLVQGAKPNKFRKVAKMPESATPTTVQENRVRVGLRRAFWALREEDGKYDTVHEFLWPEEATISNGNGNDFVIYAGDDPRYRKSGGSSKEISVQMTKFERAFLASCCSHVLESEATGGITDTGDGKAKEFAFGFETTGDQGNIRAWYFGCTSTTPTHSAKTNAENPNEDPDTATFTAVRVKCGDGTYRVSTTFEPGDAGYEAAFTKVPSQGV